MGTGAGASPAGGGGGGSSTMASGGDCVGVAGDTSAAAGSGADSGESPHGMPAEDGMASGGVRVSVSIGDSSDETAALGVGG